MVDGGLQDYLLALCRVTPFPIVEAALRAAQGPSESLGAVGGVPLLSRWLDGTVLHAELANFSSVSDRITSSGLQGANRLACCLDAITSEIIDKALLPFGGHTVHLDATKITVVFEGPNAATRAVAAALRIRDFDRAENARSLGLEATQLIYRLAVTSGPVRLAIIGDAGSQLVTCAGLTSKRAVRLQKRAPPGQVAIDDATYAALGSAAEVEPIQDAKDAVIVRAIKVEPVETPPLSLVSLLPSDTAVVQAQIALLEPFVASRLARRLKSSPRGWRTDGESIRALIVTVNVGGVSESPETNEPALSAITRIFRRHGGVPMRIDVTSRGHRVVIAFGLHTDSTPPAEDALLAALETITQLKSMVSSFGSAISVSAGVDEGLVHLCAVGSDHRHVVTLLGTVVTSSMRIAKEAPPFALLASAAAVALTEGGVVTAPHVPVWHGATQRDVAIVLAPAESVAHYLELRSQRKFLAGRSPQRTALASLVRNPATRQRAVVGLVGEPGTGKSSLLSVVIDEWTGRGGIGMIARCRQATNLQSLAPIASMLTTMLGMPRAGDHDLRRLRIVARLRARARVSAPELLQLLIASADDDNAAAEQLLADPLTRDRLLEALVRLLAEAEGGGPMLLVFEDLHLADEATRQFCAKLAALPTSEFPHPVLVTYRPQPSVHELRLALKTEIEVGPLVDDDIVALVNHEFNSHSVAPTVLGFLRQRTAGNPAHLVDLIRLISERELLTIRGGMVVAPTGGIAVLEEELPFLASQVALARLHQLDGPELRLLCVASVIGLTFSHDVLAQAVKHEFDPSQIATTLELLVRRRLVSIAAPNHEFHDAMTQAAVYESVSHDERRKLHETIAAIFETPGNPSRTTLGEAGFHRERAGQFAEACNNYALAAASALAAELNEKAGHFAERWLACRKLLGKRFVGEPDVAARMAMIRVTAFGRRRLASETLAYANAAMAENRQYLDEQSVLELRYWMGMSYAWLGQPQLALENLCDVVENSRDAKLKCEAAIRIAQTLDYALDRPAALTWLAQAKELALDNRGLTAEVEFHRTHLNDDPSQLEQSRATYRRLQTEFASHGQCCLAARAANAAAHCDLHLRNFEAARAGFEAATKLNRVAGNWQDLPTPLSNLGQAYLWDGKAKQAIRPFEEALRYAEDAEDVLAVAEVMVHLGAAIAMTRDPQEGLRLCVRGGVLAGESGLREAEIAHWLLRTELSLRAGDAPAAISAFRRCVEARSEITTPLFSVVFDSLALRLGYPTNQN